MTAQEWPSLRQWLLATAIVLLFAAVLALLVALDLGWLPPALLVVLAIGLYALQVKRGPPPSPQESDALEAMGTLFKGVAAVLVSVVLLPVLLTRGSGHRGRRVRRHLHLAQAPPARW